MTKGWPTANQPLSNKHRLAKHGEIPLKLLHRHIALPLNQSDRQINTQTQPHRQHCHDITIVWQAALNKHRLAKHGEILSIGTGTMPSNLAIQPIRSKNRSWSPSNGWQMKRGDRQINKQTQPLVNLLFAGNTGCPKSIDSTLNAYILAIFWPIDLKF